MVGVFYLIEKKGSFLSNGEYVYILLTCGCIYFLEKSGNFREFFSTALVDTMYSIFLAVRLNYFNNSLNKLKAK